MWQTLCDAFTFTDIHQVLHSVSQHTSVIGWMLINML